MIGEFVLKGKRCNATFSSKKLTLRDSKGAYTCKHAFKYTLGYFFFCTFLLTKYEVLN